ncbi:DMT family transporter [Paenibacillus sp. OAS669]|uniref:DMT family transporter n=1 Tax=Paenibacillus sp. OAS669 TaxID=2663821 RepID=UPI001789D7C7|nr:DMT family transporter [Paenibacillus sp. OAS669]MBE1443596.1 drug/metabolite transporter (DMT)-like permease [Paenibacillus sp. OAS669]
MGYFLLFLATLSWSFVGILVKTASGMVDSTTITFARFALGIVFLGILLLLKDGRIKLRGNMKWIWLGALGKSCNYFFENLALSIGYSYGNILVGPIQTVILLLVSAFYFKEHVSARGWAAAGLCIGGVLMISWNGLPLHQMLASNGLTTVLFIFSAVGTTFHVLSQKMLIQSMDAENMNFSVFFWCSLLMALPLPVQAHATGPVNGWAIAALLGLGLITGLSFNWFAQALKRVSFAVAVIVSNSGVLFTIAWSYLFFHDPITIYIIGGAGVFVAGLLLLNWPLKQKVKLDQSKRLEA